MTRRAVYLIMGAAGLAVCGVIALVLAISAGGGDDSRNDATINEPAASDAAPADAVSQDTSDGATQEGIAVHGHWTIEVREADGQLVQRQEFENELVSSGQLFLAGILTREFGVSGWGIMLLNLSPDSGPCDSVDDSIAQDCLIVEDPAPANLTNWANTVQSNTLEVSRTGATFDTLTLIGTADATSDGTITWVASALCVASPPSLDPQACNNASFFTQKSLPAPVALSTGQQIYVRVDITFS